MDRNRADVDGELANTVHELAGRILTQRTARESQRRHRGMQRLSDVRFVERQPIQDGVQVVFAISPRRQRPDDDEPLVSVQ